MKRLIFCILLFCVFIPASAEAGIRINEIAWPRRPRRAWCRGKMGTILLFAFLFIPVPAYADVRINEVAWMGTESSYADEWIELYNDGGEAVALTGWTLSWGDTSIALEGAIDAGGLFLLERTDDDSVPNKTADLIYTGGLSNSGETLTLSDENGDVVDNVIGGEDWENIGGDNESKQTAQRVSAEEWQTAEPTPKSVNTVQNNEEDTNADSSEEPVDIREPEDIFGTTHIDVSAGGDRRVVVGAPVEYEGKAVGFNGGELTEAEFLWSFGNGELIDERIVEHAYRQPGTYAVVLTVASGKHSGRDEVVVRAEPADISITDVTPVYIAITNNDIHELDLSDWLLRREGETFIFPENTKILPDTTVRFESVVTELPVVGSDVSLAYPTGQRAVAYDTSRIESEENEARERTYAPPAEQKRTTKRSLPEATSKNEGEEKERTSKTVQTASVGRTDTHGMLPWLLALTGLIGAGIVSARAFRKRDAEHEYDIEDM